MNKDVSGILSNIYDRFFCENSLQLLGVNYFRKRAPSKYLAGT